LTEAAAVETVRRVELTRVIRAKRARVFEAWTNPEIIGKWLPPGNMIGGKNSIDLRVGGRYRVEMKGGMEVHNAERELEKDDPVVTGEGVYRKIVPNERLVYTWAGSWNPAEETLVTVTFRDVDSGTEIHLVHEGFTSDQSLAAHKSGWEGSFHKLEGLFAS